MRILHILHQYLPEKVGGTEYYTRGLAQEQVKLGHSVAIFCPAVGQYVQPTVEEGIRVYRATVGERSPTAVFRHSFGQRAIAETFSAVLRQERPDIVHIQHLMGLPFQVVNQITAVGIPYVVTLHDYWHLCANAQLLTNYNQTVCAGPNWWLNCAHCAIARAGHPNALPLIPAIAPLLAYRHTQTRQLLTQASAIIAPAEFVRQVHLSMGLPPEKIQVVVHGIEIPTHMPARTFPHAGLRLAYIGGLAWQKGIHVLIEAVNQLPHEGVELTIFGDTAVFPSYISHLQQLIRHPHIQLAGILSRADFWQTLVQFDALIVPTLWYETSSLIVQEAFAAKLPVVVSDIGVLREKVQQGIDGLRFPPGDVAALRDLLQQLQQNPQQLASLQQGIQPIRTIQQHVTEVETVYMLAKGR